MKLRSHVFLWSLLVFTSGCQKEIDDNQQVEKELATTGVDQEAADKASLLAAAKEAGVSEEEALAAKAEFDKVYDETADKMSKAEAERIARDKQFKDDACITNCRDD